MLSLRLRVFLLVAIVAVAATGATAWLTLRDASTQISDTATARRQTVDSIRTELVGYGLTHGTWVGVPDLVRSLRGRTGQRIQLTTTGGEVIVDSDQLEHRTARPRPSEPAALIDAEPSADLRRVPALAVLTETLAGIDQARARVRMTACLTHRGVRFSSRPAAGVASSVVVTDVLEEVAGADLPVVKDCEARARSTAAELQADVASVGACDRKRVALAPARGTTAPAGTGRAVDDLRRCAAAAFSRRLTEVAPVGLLLYLGTAARPAGPVISASRVILAAGAVALLAIMATMVVTRRVLRPVATLIRASQRLGAGDLSGRVPVHGRDELAEMASAFNRMADSLERSEAQQRRMIGDVAHELRTPLANVRGYLEALKDGVLQPTPELFASLHEEAVLQQRLVDDLQELALAEAGALVYHPVRLDPAELLETCRTAHKALAEAAGVGLRVEADPMPALNGDPDRLRQAIGNLVSNALRATRPGGSVVLRGRRQDDEVLLAVDDTGSGIQAADLPHVFDRLYRVDSARGRETGGSGLGLAIAREIVTAHGGTISASSTPGVGSVFTIALPAATGPE